MKDKFLRLKYACYGSNMSMSIVAGVTPLLLLTFRDMYGISYSLLGLLIFINFFTQLIIDLIFSFFSYKFDIAKVVKTTPIITLVGLVLYAVLPTIFPQFAYAGLLIGTVIFSASCGLVEVLISPVIAAIPSENPELEMSKLHSVYAWGVVIVILISTVLLKLLGSERWPIIVFVLALIPLSSAILFSKSEVPKLETPKKLSGAFKFFKNPQVLLCLMAIFFGGAAENTMEQWSSGYLEQALGIPKIYGDIFGVALFCVMLGLGRTLYAKYGKNIHRVIIFGAIGTVVCYAVSAFTPVPILGLLACALSGFTTSMMWPGNLIIASNRFPESGVFIYAAMAAGGDFGASVAPQIVGLVADFAIANPKISAFAESISLAPDQFGMKLGMLAGMFFPLIAIFIYLYNAKLSKREEK